MVYGVPPFFRSVRFALRGLAAVWRAEQNFRIQLTAFFVALLVAAWVRLRAWEVVALVVVGGSVLVLECLNSAVEHLIDLVQPRLHGYVREIKDMMAAAVLVAALVAALIAAIIFVPRLAS